MDHPIDGVAERVQDARPSAPAAGPDALAGPGKGAVRSGRHRRSEPAARARALVHMRPLGAVLGAGVLGLAVGWLIGRRR